MRANQDISNARRNFTALFKKINELYKSNGQKPPFTPEVFEQTESEGEPDPMAWREVRAFSKTTADNEGINVNLLVDIVVKLIDELNINDKTSLYKEVIEICSKLNTNDASKKCAEVALICGDHRVNKLKDYENAISDYKYAQKLDPTILKITTDKIRKTTLNLISLLKDKNNSVEKYDRIIKLYEEIRDPNNDLDREERGVAYFHRGNAHLKSNEPDKALQDYETAARLYPFLTREIAQKKKHVIDMKTNAKNEKLAKEKAVEKERAAARNEKLAKEKEIEKERAAAREEIDKTVQLQQKTLFNPYARDRDPEASPNQKLRKNQKTEITDDIKMLVVNLTLAIIDKKNDFFWEEKALKAPKLWQKNEKNESKLPDSFPLIRDAINDKTRDYNAKYDALQNVVGKIEFKPFRRGDTKALYKAIAENDTDALQKLQERIDNKKTLKFEIPKTKISFDNDNNL